MAIVYLNVNTKMPKKTQQMANPGDVTAYQLPETLGMRTAFLPEVVQQTIDRSDI